MAEKNVPFSKSDMAALARSPAGQALYAQLQQRNEAELRRAMTLAASGDMNGAGAILAPLLSDPAIRAMVEKLGGQ